MAGHTCPVVFRAPWRTALPARLLPARLISQPQPAACRPGARQKLCRRVVAAAVSETGPTFRIPELPETPPAYAANADKYAIVEIGGHQIFVEEGRWYTVNRLVAAPGSKIQLRRVVGYKSNGQFTCGRPFLEDVVVEADVLEDLKGPKVHIFKYRAKKHYRRRTGHRQPLTKFLVTKIQS